MINPFHSQSNKWPWVMFIIVVIGVILRFDQFFIQVLTDDEWHSVNNLMVSSPSQIIKSFGYTDYSIPLSLLYWAESQLFGLSELLMRWPMMLFGLMTLGLFILYVYRRFSRFESTAFAFLLALSPIIISYSRIARPYAITLFLAYFCLWLFYKYYHAKDKKISNIIIYSIIASLTVWMHLIMALFIASPFVIESLRLFFYKNKLSQFIKLLSIGLPAFILMCVLILPPLFNDLYSLSAKAGIGLPNIDTIIGTLFLFAGSKYSGFVILYWIFATIGLYPILKKSLICFNIFVASLLTIVAIILLKPDFIELPIVFARYIFPAVPMILLSVTSGIYISTLYIQAKIKNRLFQKPIIALMLLTFTATMLLNTPLRDTMQSPNSHTLHVKYTMGYRMDKNIANGFADNRPTSPYWKTLSNKPLSMRIAVAPWYFYSYAWDGPVWETLGKQQIIPGSLLGLCKDQRKGEVPNNEEYQFDNFSYLADKNDLTERDIDLIVYQKPERFDGKHQEQGFEGCEQSIKTLYGEPIYQDELITVFNAH